MLIPSYLLQVYCTMCPRKMSICDEGTNFKVEINHLNSCFYFKQKF